MNDIRNIAAWLNRTGESPRWIVVLLLVVWPSAFLGWLVVVVMGWLA